MRTLIVVALLCGVCSSALANTADEGYAIEHDIAYQPEHPSDYARERGVLDLYYPEDREGFATVVWFHAGGLVNGEKWIPPALQNQGIAIVAANYRFSPNAKAPAYIEDAAAAVAWTLDHIAEYGGDPSLVFVSGHSAGGYLTSMVGLDNRWLEGHERNPDELAGLIPVSGHTITHFTVRAERDIPGTQAIIDDLAPQFHARPDCPPFLLITGDREMELLGRYEENAFFWRMMQEVGHPDCTIEELGGFDHGGVARPSFELILRFIERISTSRLSDPAAPAPSD